MTARALLWVMTALDALLLIPAFYMAIGAVGIASANPTAAPVVLAALFFALPVFCIAAPLAAWRAQRKRAQNVNAIVLAAMPLVYAAFLMIFLYSE